MAHETKNDEDKGAEAPYIVYRNPQDDKVQLALQEAERRLRAQVKPLVKD